MPSIVRKFTAPEVEDDGDVVLKTDGNATLEIDGMDPAWLAAQDQWFRMESARAADVWASSGPVQRRLGTARAWTHESETKPQYKPDAVVVVAGPKNLVPFAAVMQYMLLAWEVLDVTRDISDVYTATCHVAVYSLTGQGIAWHIACRVARRALLIAVRLLCLVWKCVACKTVATVARNVRFLITVLVLAMFLMPGVFYPQEAEPVPEVERHTCVWYQTGIPGVWWEKKLPALEVTFEETPFGYCVKATNDRLGKAVLRELAFKNMPERFPADGAPPCEDLPDSYGPGWAIYPWAPTPTPPAPRRVYVVHVSSESGRNMRSHHVVSRKSYT